MKTAAFVVAIIVSSLVLGLGCAGPVVVACHDRGTPYTHERPTRPFTVTIAKNGVDAWTADGAPTVLTVHNPTARRRLVHVVCNPSVRFDYIDRGNIEGYFCLAPHTEAMRLTEFMNVDAMTQVCHVVDADEVECAL